MNEKVRFYLSWVLCAVFGASIATSVIFSTAIKHSDKLLRDAQSTITQLADTNRRLQEDYRLAQSTATELEGRLAERQGVINNIAATVDSMSAGLGQSADLIQQIIDTVSELERLIHD